MYITKINSKAFAIPIPTAINALELIFVKHLYNDTYCIMDLIPYSRAPLILFNITYTLESLP